MNKNLFVSKFNIRKKGKFVYFLFLKLVILVNKQFNLKFKIKLL